MKVYTEIYRLILLVSILTYGSDNDTNHSEDDEIPLGCSLHCQQKEQAAHLIRIRALVAEQKRLQNCYNLSVPTTEKYDPRHYENS